MITEGQKLALKQLNEVNQIDNYGFDITKILEPDNDSPFLKVDLSIHCGEFKKEKGGLPLKEREKFRIVIPKDFPVSYPSIFTLHFRFAGWPHVQWKNSLCLYQSPDNEWNPEDGIYGYLDRLLDWLKHGALNELDPTGQPLHPPVTYRTSTSTSTIVPKVDTPSMNKNPWLGLARLEEINKDTFSITEWVDIDKKTKSGKYAAAILLPKPFPFEYPLKANELLREFKSIGISYKMFMLVLQAAIIYKESDHPLFLIVGTPMRGIKGEDLPKQHLSAWEFGESETKYIKISAEKYSANLKISEIGREMETILEKYLDSVKISWCRIFEDRPEIVNRRDINSNISVFKDKRITIWGCGAIGSNIAVYLARAGVGKLNLSDNDIVTPGIIVRQQYHEADIGKRKIDALEIIIKSINNNIEIEKNDADLKKWLSTNPKLSEQTDFVIDCTASNLVHNIFEKHFKQTLRNSVPIISMIVSSDCEKAISINIGKNHTGGIFDVYRKAALYACKETDLKSFADDFYPDKDDRNRKLFQPEPGCSDPTFIGSSSDSATLAGLMLDCASNIYKLKNDRASVYYISKKGSENFIFKIHEVDSDYITIDKISGYECRISKGAMNSISAEIKRNNRVRNESTETGGLLFGYRSMFLKTIWIDKATEPPPDSEFDEKFFKCGTSGTKTISEKFKNFSRGQTQFTGTWHTHPKSEPFPSTIDINGIIEILLIDNFQRKETLLLIVQPNKNKFKLGCYVLKRKDLEQKYFTIENNSNYTELENKRESLKNIGLALSGGGSRAIAFHLGCFRALNDRGLLEKINVISSVSGGSVISAMYAYKKDSFEDFDKKVIQLLKSGLDLKIAKEFLLSFAFLKELSQYIIKYPISIFCRIFKIKFQLRRNSYRTISFIRTLRKNIFGHTKITDNRNNNVDVVFNTTELRTGTAFRFSSKNSGNWRFGLIKDNDIEIAEAVALSAAYPLFLPSSDKNFDFVKNKHTKRKRVVLSDGGIYDNIGVSCMEPGKNPTYSTVIFKPEYIIACNAGYGMLTGDFIPFGLITRFKQIFLTTMRKVQDATMHRLHIYKETNKIKGFVLPYLGQLDQYLPYKWPDLVKRQDVDYPTDFRPMKVKDIELLSKRGEQLTRLLLEHYCPTL